MCNSRNKYIIPFILITSLFFLWGFARSVLDVLNKHFQETLNVSIADSMMIQASTYVAYALMAIPAGMLITGKGYRKGLVFGLSLFSIGCLLFIPGSITSSFGLFLMALFVIGCGLATLETAANPYVAELGDPATAPSRLNLSQSFNGLGCMLGPIVVGGFLFSDSESSVAVPYTIMGIFVGLMALLFTKIRLPELSPGTGGDEGSSFRASAKRLWGNRYFIAGLIALFCYEVAEIGINSIFINYTMLAGNLSKIESTFLLSFGGLGIFMLARVAGSWIMRVVSARKVLGICAVFSILCALTVALSSGKIALVALIGCFAFEAIMFPTIFAMTIAGVEEDAKAASAFLMMTPLGGAVGAWLMGLMAKAMDISYAFFIPAIAYGVIMCYIKVIAKRTA